MEGYRVVALPAVRSFDRYLRVIRQRFPVRDGLSASQLWDVHLDWTAETRTLIIFPDVHGFLKKSPHELIQVLSDYVTRAGWSDRSAHPRFRVLVTSKTSLAGVVDALRIHVGQGTFPLGSDVPHARELVERIERPSAPAGGVNARSIEGGSTR